jgi:hypothetical protein
VADWDAIFRRLRLLVRWEYYPVDVLGFVQRAALRILFKQM